MKLIFPVKSDGLVRICNFTEHHITSTYVSWLNDQEIVRYSEQRHITHTINSCREYFVRQEASENYFLAIEYLEGRLLHIGNLGVSVDLNNNIADLSIIIGNKSLWGKGIATRAWRLALCTILGELNFRLATAGTMDVNKPMVNLIKRSGMHIDGILPKRFLFEGNEVGMVTASLSKNDLIV